MLINSRLDPPSSRFCQAHRYSCHGPLRGEAYPHGRGNGGKKLGKFQGWTRHEKTVHKWSLMIKMKNLICLCHFQVSHLCACQKWSQSVQPLMRDRLHGRTDRRTQCKNIYIDIYINLYIYIKWNIYLLLIKEMHYILS